MPRVSSAPEDAFHFKGTFADGWGEVVDAKALVFQFPPTKEDKGARAAGTQDPPALFAELMIQRLTADGAKSSEQPEQVLLSIARAARDTGILDTCHPGNYPEGDFARDPEDAGGDLGAEGNTLFAVADGFQLNDKTKWMTFTQSLQEKGFNPAILKRTYFPDLIGLRAMFKTETRKKFRDDQTSDPTVFVVSEIKQYPYEKAAAKPAAATKKTPATKATPTPTTTTAAVAPVGPNGATEISAEDIATAILTETLGPSQKGAVFPNIQKLKVTVFLAINKHKPAVPPALKKAVQDQLGNEEWLTAVGQASGLFEIAENGQIQFSS